ncbi:MAG: ribosome small subunit-dependent GTPase A [Thermogutta sp.]
MGKRKKVRIDFRRKNKGDTRDKSLTRRYAADDSLLEDLSPAQESGTRKGAITRKGTVIAGDSVENLDSGSPFSVFLEPSSRDVVRGRVVAVQGLICLVEDEASRSYRCVLRQVLKRLLTRQRSAVVTGDLVLFRTVGGRDGVIESVLPRRGVLSREYRGREHVIISNVDQMLIVGSASQPRLKPHLIDRFLVAAEKSGVRPVICINKIDLIEAAALQPLVGLYSQLGYRVLLVSAKTGFGLDRLIRLLQGRVSVLAGQSGVGKSSLLNALDPDLKLAVGEVSEENEKGRHTTTTARIFRFRFGGYVADTPGLRQFQCWDLVREETANYFVEMRPYLSRCRFPDCLHLDEADCSVKNAVADGWIDERRYESYRHLISEEAAELPLDEQ